MDHIAGALCAAPCHRPGDPTHRPRTNVPASPPYRLKEAGRWRVAAPTGAPSSLCRNLASAARWSSRSPHAARRCPREVCRHHSASPCTEAAVVAPHASSQLAAAHEVRSCCSPCEVFPTPRTNSDSQLAPKSKREKAPRLPAPRYGLVALVPPESSGVPPPPRTTTTTPTPMRRHR